MAEKKRKRWGEVQRKRVSKRRKELEEYGSGIERREKMK